MKSRPDIESYNDIEVDPELRAELNKLYNEERYQLEKQANHESGITLDIIKNKEYTYDPTNTWIEHMDKKHWLDTLEPIDKHIVMFLMQGYTQQETAEVIGISQSYVSQRLTMLRYKHNKRDCVIKYP